MKRLILITLFFILMATTTFAQLYIGVDPDVEAVEYMLDFDGNTIGPFPYVELRQDVTVVYDIQSLVVPDTKHTMRVAAMNLWGDLSEWSDPLELVLLSTGGAIVRQQPKVPVSIRLLSN